MSTLQERRDAEILRYEEAYKHPSYCMKQWRMENFDEYLVRAPQPCANMLDVGCGRGEALEIAKQHKIEAMGVEVVSYLCDHKHVLHIEGAHDLSLFPDHGFDLVTSLDVMEHILEEEVETVLKEMWRVAKKILFLGISHRPSPYHITLHQPGWWALHIQEAVAMPRRWTPSNFDRDDYSYWQVTR